MRRTLIFLCACVVGILSGLLGVGGGVVLVPMLVLLFGFDQRRAQGTSLIALVPPTGLLAFLEYYHAGHVNLRAGLLLIPGIFLGGFVGSRLAGRISSRRIARLFAALMLLLGIWEVYFSWCR
jgi:uncharacterized membrane protein YfcA